MGSEIIPPEFYIKRKSIVKRLGDMIVGIVGLDFMQKKLATLR